jgi:hypothetical protein
MNKTFKDRVAASSATLVAAIVYAALTWAATGLTDPYNWAGFGAMLIVAVALRRMSNGNALMRMRTWLVPATYISLCATFTFSHAFNYMQIGVMLYAIALYFLFQSYQRYHAERWIFPSFFFLSCASLCFPPLVWMALAFYLAMLVQLRVFYVRTIAAGIFGLIIPMQLFAGISFFIDRTDLIAGYFMQMVNFDPIDIRTWELSPTVSIVFVFLLFVISIFHYAHTNFNDKIRTRMYFYILITQSLIFYIFLILQPQFYESLTCFALLTTSPIAGHYFAFSRGVAGNFFFTLFLLLMFVLAAFNLWQSSSVSF